MFLRFLFPAQARQLQIDAGRVLLRTPLPGDWKAWAELRAESREFLQPWEPTWPRDALTRQAYHRRLGYYAGEWRQASGYALFLLRQADQELLGGISLLNVRRGVAQTASLGYWIGRPHARQGYMTEAISGVLDFAFDKLGLHRVEAACLPHNAPSRGLLAKSGFREEGFAREYLRINGRWQDHVLFAILRDDPRPPIEGLP